MSEKSTNTSMSALAIGAIGVVYGDIGTSPLYTMHEVFAGSHQLDINPGNVLAILSLIFWSLIFVVSVKYVAFIMRADNHGEGGIMALMALALRTTEGRPRSSQWILMLGIFGAALFYGDGVITPAISVLSAVEGIEIATPGLQPYVIPITLSVLFVLFWFQKKGTASIGALFGPIMGIWFLTLAILGVINIMHEPAVFHAINPLHALHFIADHKMAAFFSLGGVVLALTGAEALYADMGHFGRKPIQLAWFWLVLPSLALNYFGQGALLLHDHKAIENPFYLLAPNWALYPLIILATIATIIASQAVISGAYSITKQAMQLGYAPRMNVLHTSEETAGQIYLPFINWTLLVAIFILVINFKSSTNLGAAYGIAVTGTMVITTILAFVVVRKLWGWSLLTGSLVIGFLMIIDFAYFSANAIKIEEGGWVPLAMGLFAYTLMTTWRKGRALHLKRIKEEGDELEAFINMMKDHPPFRPDGTAVYMTTHTSGVPHALLHNLYHNQVLHQNILLVTTKTEDIPHVPDEARVRVEHLHSGFHRVIVHYGFKDEIDIPRALELSRAQEIDYEMMRTSFFLGRDTLIPKTHSELPYWREMLYVWLFRNAGSATAYFKIPPNRVIELGTQRIL
jgi:KUP system potassium uptake protein